MSIENRKIEQTMKYSQINICLQNNMLDNLETWEIEPMEMYQDIFSTMELEEKGKQEQGKYNLICIQVGYDNKLNKKNVKRFFIHQGLKELNKLIKSKTDDFCLMSCISFAGLQNNHNNARFMYALVIDLDDIRIGDENHSNGLELIDMICGRNKSSPIPNYIVSSGNGLHLYFLFDKPIAMYKKSQELLFDLKKEIVKIFWNKYISASPEQHGNIIQGFRIAGTKTKDKKNIVKCFKVSDTKKYTPYELADFTSLKNKNDFISMTKKSSLTLEEAKRKYPEWYEKRIIKKEKPKKWHIKRDLYDWFKRKILEKDSKIVGHRYFCCMCLVVYAIKCDIDYEELKKDLYTIQPILNDKGDPEQSFTIQDIKDALKVYSDNVNIYTRARMELLSGIDMPPNKRNGLTQKEHLYLARNRKKDLIFLGKCVNGGRDKQDIVFNYLLDNDTKRKLSDIMRECKVSKHTAIKYFREWKKEHSMI